ncbi:hypothetical protein LINPERHAP1_LOCUS12853 [Linum perenne]
MSQNFPFFSLFINASTLLFSSQTFLSFLSLFSLLIFILLYSRNTMNKILTLNSYLSTPPPTSSVFAAAVVPLQRRSRAHRHRRRSVFVARLDPAGGPRAAIVRFIECSRRCHRVPPSLSADAAAEHAAAAVICFRHRRSISSPGRRSPPTADCRRPTPLWLPGKKKDKRFRFGD